MSESRMQQLVLECGICKEDSELLPCNVHFKHQFVFINGLPVLQVILYFYCKHCKTKNGIALPLSEN